MLDAGKKGSAADPKFLSFVKNIVVEIQRDRELYGDESIIEVGGRSNLLVEENKMH